MTLLHIAGGVALILFGIRFLRKGLNRMMGHGLHVWLERMTRSPWKTLFAGIGFGTVAPSSTAQTLLTLQLLNAGKLSAERMLTFLLAAGVGITITVQLISFNVFEYYALFLIAGLIGFQLFKSETMRGIGQTLLALGFIFLAMQLISQAGQALTHNADFQEILRIVSRHEVMLVIFAAAFAFFAQSSTATIGLAIGLANAGAADLTVLVPVVLGANLGLAITSLVAGWTTTAGRRLAVANLGIKLAGIIVCLLAFGPLLRLLDSSSGSLMRQAADFHTGFNLVLALGGMVLAPSLGRLMLRLFPSDPVAEKKTLSSHLDPQALDSPVFALVNAARETLHLADAVKAMLEGCWRAIMENNAMLARQVQLKDDAIDELHAELKHYLSQIAPDAMNPRDQQLQFGLLNFAGQLESVADIIDKHLCYHVIKHHAQSAPLSAADQADLTELYHMVLRRFEMAISVLATRERSVAKRFLQEGDTLKEWTITVQKRHYQRLDGHNNQALIASAYFLEMLNSLRRISGLINTIGHTFTPGRPKSDSDDSATEVKS